MAENSIQGVRVKHKKDTSANWTSRNPKLLNGELIIVTTDSGETRFKIGDGVKTYTQLPFTDELLYNALSAKVDKVEGKGLSTNDFTTEEKEKLASIDLDQLNNFLTIDKTDAEQGTASLINADQLGGINADQYALKSELGTAGSGVAKIVFSNVLSAANWSAEAPYSQTITVEGITADDKPHIFLDLSEATADTVDRFEEGWALVKYAETAENSITFYCITSAPTVDLPIEGEVISAETNYDSATGVEF